MTIPWGRCCPLEGGVLSLSQCSKGRTCGKGLATGVEQAQRRLNPCALSTVLESDCTLLGSRADLVTDRHFLTGSKTGTIVFVSVPSFCLPFLLPLAFLWTTASVSCPHILLFSLCLSHVCSQRTSSLLSLSASRRSAGLLPNPPLNDMILKS